MSSWTEQWIELLDSLPAGIEHADQAEKLRTIEKSGLLTLTDLQTNPARFFEAHRLVAQRCQKLGTGFWVRFTVHYNLCFGTVLAVGNDEQVQQLDEIRKQGKLGCFALTEKLAGVNSGMVVQTTADWDDATQEFVINNETEGSRKNWISAGLVADKALVVADLRVGGKSHGPHAWLVDFRKDGKLDPTVELGDMGIKTVGNDLDNAWISFHKTRVPHSSLLRRYSDVTPGNGGTYVNKAKGFTNMMMIGQRLFTGRVAVAQAALAYTRQLFAKTREYSDNKVCWGPKGDTNLTKVPQLAALYAHAEKKFQRLEAFVGECERLLSVHIEKGTAPPIKLQDSIACAKIAACETCIDLSFRLRQDVGSFALMNDTSFGFGDSDFLQACKFAEGDSRVLLQKLARDRVKAKKQVGSEQEQSMASELQKIAGQGPAAWDENFQMVYDLAWTVVSRLICELSPGEAVDVPMGISKL